MTLLVFMACMCRGTSLPLIAGPAGPSAVSAAEKEISRRERLVTEARTLIAQADLHLGKGQNVEALRLYRQAWELLPDAPMAAGLKIQARDGYSTAAVAHAKHLASEARYGEARTLLQTVLAANFNPENREAKKFEKELDDPERYEPAQSPENLARVAVVEDHLRRGYGLLSLGDYDGATEEFKQVLRTDRYNAAARRGMESIDQRKADYYESARDQARGEALTLVDKSWERPISDVSSLFGGVTASMSATIGGKDSVSVKLRTIVLPRVDLQGASLEEVVEFLRIRSRELDPQKRGVDFVLKVPQEDRNKPVSLSLKDVPLEEAIRYATEMTGTVYRMDEFAVTITSRTEQSTSLITRSYRVPPDFIQNAAATDPQAPAPGIDPFGQPGATNVATGLQIRRLGAKELLEQRGVTFVEGSSASYNASTSMLTVRNTVENLALVEAMVDDASNKSPKQVEIQVRMLEITQTRLKELGFDWLMGQFNVPGSSRLFAGGGTIGNQKSANFTGDEFPFATPGGSLVGTNPITAGLRSSGAFSATQSIDSLLGRVAAGGADVRSPSAFAVAGVFTDPQFQVVLRALDQNKGIDLVGSPSVVAKSGQRANVNVTREFRYPTEFEPPQIPQSIGAVAVGNTTAENNTANIGGFAPVIPTTPTAFEVRNVGILLEVEPVISDDNHSVDLNLVPSSTEFEGFVDYGADIMNTSINGTPYLIENDVLQPIFRTNKVSTSVTIWDGSTVVLGGVISEKSQDINDKVPIIGSMPLIGRAFQSRVTNTERKNVIFFVTVKVIDPAGNRINQAADGTAAR